LFDRRLVASRKARAARLARPGAGYLLARAADDLVFRAGALQREFAAAAVLGALDGTLGRALRAGLGARLGQLIEIEDSAGLADCAGANSLVGTAVAADLEELPLRQGAFDLVASALSLQLVNDLPGVLLQARRALKPDGLLLVSLLGGRTLHELREALLAAELETTGGASPRVAPFADVRELGALMQRAGLALPVADVDMVRASYPNALALMADLRAMGGANPLAERSRKPLRRATLARTLEIYAERFGDGRGKVTATFEIVTLTGFAPHAGQQQPLRPGAARMRLADALGVEERPAGEKVLPRPS
jgi:SAM-dependent methyltransferase